jgi:uncharacterized protein YycO
MNRVNIRVGRPKLTGEMYREVMRLSRPGDIILTRTALRPSNLFIPGHWSHAQMIGYGPEGTTIEAAMPVVRLSTLVDIWASASDVLVVRPNGVSSVDQSRAYGEAMDYIGRPYDTEFQIGDKAFYCSELIVRSYMKAGAPFTFDDLSEGVGGYQVVRPDALAGDHFKTLFDSRER